MKKINNVTHVVLAFEGWNHPFESGVGRPVPENARLLS